MNDTKKLIEELNLICQLARAYIVENRSPDEWVDSVEIQIREILEWADGECNKRGLERLDMVKFEKEIKPEIG